MNPVAAAVIAAVISGLVTLSIALLALPKVRAEGRKLDAEQRKLGADADIAIWHRLEAEIERLDKKTVRLEAELEALKESSQVRERDLERENKSLKGKIVSLEARVKELEADLERRK